jgi:hypothetical protein
VYPPGSIVPVHALGKNADALIKNRCVAWAPPPKSPPIARDLPAVEPAAPPIKVQIVESLDPVTSWLETLAATVRLANGNKQLAMDLLMADREARGLFLRAQTAGTARTAKQQRKVSVGIEEAGLL